MKLLKYDFQKKSEAKPSMLFSIEFRDGEKRYVVAEDSVKAISIATKTKKKSIVVESKVLCESHEILYQEGECHVRI